RGVPRADPSQPHHRHAQPPEDAPFAPVKRNLPPPPVYPSMCRSHELSYLVNLSLFSYRDFIAEPMYNRKILKFYGVNIINFVFVLGLQLREEKTTAPQFVIVVKCFL